MFSNNNNSVLKLLVKKDLQAKKSRNIVTILAIVLTTILFTTIFTMGSGMIDTIKEQNIRKNGGDGQVSISMINDEIFNKIKNHSSISKIGYAMLVGDAVTNKELDRWNADMWYLDSQCIKFQNIELKKGKMPQMKDEVVLDTKTLDVLGIKHQVGEKVNLSYQIKGVSQQRKFTLSGYWKTDSVSERGKILVSKDYLKENLNTLEEHTQDQMYYSGYVSAYIMFKNNFNLEGKLEKLLTDCGYQQQDEKKDNFVEAKINSAYESMEILGDPTLCVCFVIIILLIMFTGYLIIYNIFQISVIQDIQFYGKLKTLGTTRKQLKKIIKQEANTLAFRGIPVGLLIGFVLGHFLVPFLISATKYDDENKAIIEINPWIFIAAIIFSFVTIRISVKKPAKIAGGISPIDSLDYVGNLSYKKQKRKSKNGAKIFRMALSNIGLNKKRSCLVIVSLSLSLILLNMVSTLSQSLDEDKYIKSFLNSDYLISSVDYFQSNFSTSDYDLTDNFVEFVKSQDAFKEGGELYESKILEEGFTVDPQKVQAINKDKKNNAYIQMFGIDKSLLQLSGVADGTFDMKKFESGNYVLLGSEYDNQGNALDNSCSIKDGDKITFYYYNQRDNIYQPMEFEVLGKIKLQGSMLTDRSSGFTRFYMPSDKFLSIVSEKHPVSYAFNIKKGSDDSMNRSLDNYKEKIDAHMEYSSRQVYKENFKGMTIMIMVIGTALTIIIGLIGIINFINSIITSIISRHKEFAVLQSIGMTGKQLRWMLCMEGGYYAIGTLIFAISIGSILSLTVEKSIINSFEYFTYHFSIWPIFVMLPILAAMAIVVPVISYNKIIRQSIVERLRSGE